MENFIKIREEIISQLAGIKYSGDLSDLGNEIGIVIARYFDKDNKAADFIQGLKHGISLTDGSHDTEELPKNKRHGNM